jgi:peptidase E
VLLTSAGWFNDTDNRGNTQIRNRFLAMLEKPARESKVLFIPTAAIDEESQRMVERCKNDLLHAGILPQNITVYDLDGLLTDEEAMTYDVLYFTGGNTGYLLRRIKETGFDAIIRKMVHGNKVYVGVSAGSIIAARDISTATCTDMAPDLNGLALLHAYLSVHCPEGTQPRNDLPLPHIPLTNNQALAVSYSGYERISG